MSPVKGNPFHSHLKFSFVLWNEGDRNSGWKCFKSESPLTMPRVRGSAWRVTCTTLLSVPFISDSEFPTILFSTLLQTCYYFCVYRKVGRVSLSLIYVPGLVVFFHLTVWFCIRLFSSFISFRSTPFSFSFGFYFLSWLQSAETKRWLTFQVLHLLFRIMIYA